MPTPETDTPTTASKPKKRRVWRWALGGVLGLIVLVGIGLPFAVSLAGPGLLRDELATSFRTEVSVGSVSFSWFDGVQAEALKVAQPDGFSGDAALQVDHVHVDFSWSALLVGNFDVAASIEAPRVWVHRNAAGELNWTQVLPPSRSGEKDGDEKPDEESGDWPDLQLDLRLQGGEVVFVDEATGTRRRIHDLHASARNTDFASPIELLVEATVPGRAQDTEARLHIDGSVDPRAGEGGALTLQLEPLDLAPWGDLLAAFGGTVDALEGSLEGEVRASWTTAEQQAGLSKLEQEGELRGTDVLARGGSLGERVFRTPQLRVLPVVSWSPRSQRLQMEDLLVDLGVLQLRGAAPTDLERPSDMSLELSVGLDRLAAQEGWLPESLAGLQGALELQLELNSEAAPLSPDFFTGPLAVQLSGQGSKLAWTSDLLPSELIVPRTLGLDLPLQLDFSGDSMLRVAGGRVMLGQNEVRLGQLELTGDIFSTSTNVLLDAPTTASIMAAWGPPETRTSSGLGVNFQMRWPIDPSTENLAELLAAIDFAADLQLPRVNFLENEIRSLPLSVSVEEGRVFAKAGEGAQLNRGGLSLDLSWDPRDDAPLDFRLALTDGSVGSSWTPALRYAVPLLAGLRVDRLDDLATIQFRSGIDLVLAMSGPTAMGEGQGWLDLLNRWTGDGSLELADGVFTPSSQFAQLQEWIGEERELRFEKIDTSFELAKGLLSTRQLDYSRGDKTFGLSGNTNLSGDLDWKISLKPWLERSKRGQQILTVMKAPVVPLEGNLTSPSVLLPDLQQMLLNSGRGLLDQFGKDPKGTIEGLRGLFDRRKKRDRDGR